MTRRPIVHFEIPANNREAGAKFYADVFGWGYEHMPGEFNYTGLETGSIGGGMPDLDGQNYNAGDVILYIGSDDIPADLKSIEQHGGKALSEEMEVPGYGSLAFFADPSGNRLALWKSLDNGT